MDIDSYVECVTTGLRLPHERVADIGEELRSHLEDAVRDLQLRGLPRAESEQEAIRRCGPALAIATAFAEEERPDRLLCRGRHSRPVLLAAALATALLTLGGAAVATAHNSPPAAVHNIPTALRAPLQSRASLATSRCSDAQAHEGAACQ
jgi:hypothetical protein